MPDSSSHRQATPAGFSCPLRREKLVSKFCEVIPSTLAAMEGVLEKVLSVARVLPCAPKEMEEVELALREALANAILHGSQGDPEKNVLVACFCECEADGGLLLVVRDEGHGFNPALVADPTQGQNLYAKQGRGIFLMRRLMDEVRYLNDGSEVELRKQRKRSSP